MSSEQFPIETEQEEVEQETPFTLTDKEVGNLLSDIVDEVEREEDSYRSGMLQFLRKLDLFWHHIQRIYWSDTTKDFLTVADIEDPELRAEVEGLDEVINIYRAHGESIIAALSTGIPQVRFFPADADNPNDIVAAKNYSRIVELIQRRAKAPVIFLKALFTLWNQHFVAAYHYSKEDKKFGFHEVSKIEYEQQEVPVVICNECGEEYQQFPSNCSVCGSPDLVPSVKIVDTPVPRIERIPKSSQVIEIYGPLNVLIQKESRTIQDTGIVELFTENDVAKVYATYPELFEKINGTPDDDSDSDSRSVHNSIGVENRVTVRQVWLRPWMFYRLGYNKKQEIAVLQERFSDGVYFVKIQNEVTDIHPENLDDRWTFTESPISRTVIADPIGQALVSIQETVNDIYAISRETASHAIPETFYDQAILDANKYEQVQAKPGMFFPVKRQSGQSIAESFYQSRPATLSRELDTFRSRNDNDAQFVTGAFPSIYGGPNEGGSGTLGEYSMSKNMALQRLQIHWKTLVAWWVELMSKAALDFKENMEGDESFVKKNGSSFSNVKISQAELQSGKIGQIEAEGTEQLPISWAQKKDIVMQLLTLNNETLNFALFHPENASLVASLIGVPEFYVPGDEDRTKQLLEIGKLLISQPVDEMTPSLPIEPDVDNDEVHVAVIRAWANSETGQEAKFSQDRSAGYMNVLLHGKQHLDRMNQMQAPAPNPEEEKGKVPPKKTKLDRAESEAQSTS